MCRHRLGDRDGPGPAAGAASPSDGSEVEAARRAGASAKFAGSGGAVGGVYPDGDVFQRLQSELGKIGCQVLRPLTAGP